LLVRPLETRKPEGGVTPERKRQKGKKKKKGIKMRRKVFDVGDSLLVIKKLVIYLCVLLLNNALGSYKLWVVLVISQLIQEVEAGVVEVCTLNVGRSVLQELTACRRRRGG